MLRENHTTRPQARLFTDGNKARDENFRSQFPVTDVVGLDEIRGAPENIIFRVSWTLF